MQDEIDALFLSFKQIGCYGGIGTMKPFSCLQEGNSWTLWGESDLASHNAHNLPLIANSTSEQHNYIRRKHLLPYGRGIIIDPAHFILRLLLCIVMS